MGVWIEISVFYQGTLSKNVTPFAGVWIEIQNMKLEHRQKISLSVTPFMGVWIEISVFYQGTLSKNVTPFAGVWIEIQNMKLEHRQKISLSS